MNEKSIRFTFTGRELIGQQNDTVATALLRNKIRIFDRSMKQRRKRGVSCLEGYCMSCLLEVNGEPDTVTCRTQLREGMVVNPQVAWPSPNTDFLAPFQSNAFKIFGTELYYRLFTRPVWVNEYWINFLSRMSGRARLNIHSQPPTPLPFKTLSTQVLIIGGGVAGIACAKELSEAGIQALLIERNKNIGGWWLRWKSLGNPPVELDPLLYNDLFVPSEVQILTETTVNGLYEDKTALAISQNSAYRIHYQMVVIATGSYPRLLAYHGSDGPLNLPAQGIIRSAIDTGWYPESIVLLETDNSRFSMARFLERLGIEVYVHHLSHNKTVIDGLIVNNRKSKNRLTLESGKKIDVDAVCWAAGYKPKLELIRQAGGIAFYQAEDNEFLPMLKHNVQVDEITFVAGGCSGVKGFNASYLHGKLVGKTIITKLHPIHGIGDNR
jgi:thioredoxin reductase